MAKPKNLAKQIKELEDPVPKDFDPEDDKPAQESDSESGDESDDGLAGTEHYVQVGKSKLRKPEEVALGPQYAGSRVSREQLMNGDDDDESISVYESADEGAKFEGMEFDGEFDDMEVDSDEALGESDEERFKDFVFRGSGKPKKPVNAKKPVDVNGVKKRPTAADFMSDSGEEGVKLSEEEDDDDDDDDEEDIEDEEADETDEDIFDIDAQHPEAMEDIEENSDDDEEHSENPDQSAEEEIGSDEESEEDASDEGENDEDEQARRAELRKIMGEEQKTVVATISQAAKADADKGNAVKQQRKAFDSLLNVRIRLQKALVATNSLAAADDKDQEDSDENPFQAAEEAAIKLWNTIDGLRNDLSKASSTPKTGQKRKRGIDSATPSSAIWERMQASEVANIDNRQTVLEKWSSKVRATTALPISRKLNPNAPQQSITSLIQDTLSSSEHLISRTKIPRSCAPVQKQMKLTTDPNIYDDADFYQLLLKELLDQRMVDSSSAATGEAGKPMQWTAVKEAKTRKNVDTKASKGRKMKFTVHEKLQNFMAPEDRNTWEETARDRFFATLLGRKLDLGENGDEEDVSEDEGLKEEEGLMLFRS
ncbi:rRNA-processing protein bfr2 [Ciborinia camelliae]|nr:rRNA-processing protein bfr2 [Ciborinia camelliae]